MNKITLISLSISTILLTACGGGGGSSEPSAKKDPVVVTPPPVEIVPEVDPTVDSHGISYALPEVDYAQGGVLFHQDFNQYDILSLITEEDLHNDLGCYVGRCFYSNIDRATVEDGKLITTTPAGEYGAVSVEKQFYINYEELYSSYKITFGETFDFKRGGKLPGLQGITVGGDHEHPTGGNTITGYNGFSARQSFDDYGDASPYIYHMNSTHVASDGRTYGEGKHQGDFYTGTDGNPFIFERGREYHLEQYVKMNDVGVANGIVEIYINGTQVFSRNTYEFRASYDIGINTFSLLTMHGGNDDSWAPTVDSSFYLDDIVVSETPMTFTVD